MKQFRGFLESMFSTHLFFVDLIIGILNKDNIIFGLNKRLSLGYKSKTVLQGTTGSKITLTSNQIKDILKVIRYLENKGILWNGTTRKISIQEGGFLNFFRPLMTADLPIMKNLLTPLPKSALVSLRLTAAAWATDATIQKTIYGSGRASVFK